MFGSEMTQTIFFIVLYAWLMPMGAIARDLRRRGLPAPLVLLWPITYPLALIAYAMVEAEK
jgi:hypothetical protein